MEQVATIPMSRSAHTRPIHQGLRVYLGSSTPVWTELLLLVSYGLVKDAGLLPSGITYLFDAANVALFLAVCVSGCFCRVHGWRCIVYGIVAVLLVMTVLTAPLLGVTPLLFLWGFRNTFRFFAFFIIAVELLDVRALTHIVPFFKVLLFANVVLCTLEYAMGHSGDTIGGSFGFTTGCNAALNALIVISAAIYAIEYLSYRTSLLGFAVASMLCFYISSLAELKAFMIEYIIVTVLALVLCRRSRRSVALIVVGIGAIVAGLAIMQMLFPQSGASFFTGDAIDTYLGSGGYTSSGDLNRTSALSTIYTKFFARDPLRLLFGYGLGNCSYSSVSQALTSAFYTHFGWMHYIWFSDAYVFLEMGSVGLMLYWGFFIAVFVLSRRHRYHDPRLREVVDTASVLAIASIFLSIYNSTLTIEAGYLVYFVMAVPLVLDRYRPHGGEGHGARA